MFSLCSYFFFCVSLSLSLLSCARFFGLFFSSFSFGYLVMRLSSCFGPSSIRRHRLHSPSLHPRHLHTTPTTYDTYIRHRHRHRHQHTTPAHDTTHLLQSTTLRTVCHPGSILSFYCAILSFPCAILYYTYTTALLSYSDRSHRHCLLALRSLWTLYFVCIFCLLPT